MHKKQVKAYLEAAQKALEEWAVATIPLEPMEDTDTKESFVQRCIATLAKLQILPPNWKGGIPVSKVVSSTIKKRAEETFDKYHPVGNDDDDNDNNDDEQQDQEDEDLGDVEPSEGEAPSSETEGDTEEEMDTAGGQQKPAESTASKTIKNKLNTAKSKRLQKIATRKKGNMAKRKVFLNTNNKRGGKKNPGSNNNNNNNTKKG